MGGTSTGPMSWNDTGKRAGVATESKTTVSKQHINMASASVPALSFCTDFPQ